MSLSDGRVTVVLFFAICGVVLGNGLLAGNGDGRPSLSPSELDPLSRPDTPLPARLPAQSPAQSPEWSESSDHSGPPNYAVSYTHLTLPTTPYV